MASVNDFHYRGDIIVNVDWTATDGVGSAFTPFCGATSFDLTVDNAIQEQAVADCEDWSKPVETVLSYGAQSWSFNLGATMVKQNRDLLLRAVAEQRLLPVRLDIVGAQPGEVRYIDGVALLPSLSWSGIANVDGQVITTTLSGRFSGRPELTNA